MQTVRAVGSSGTLVATRAEPSDAGHVPQVADATVRNPLNPTRRIRAVLFDVDGTLYRQGPLRALMGAELAALALRRPIRAPRIWRALSEYRRAQEALRGQDEGADLARQLEMAAARARISMHELSALVDEWMIERPLKYLPRCRARGLVDLLDFLRAKRIRTGILSDYPAHKKIDALQIRGYFSLVLCGGDTEVGAFKPSPRGFLAACARWDVDPADVLYVGDRAEADGAGAAAARMPAVIVTTAQVAESRGALVVSSLERVRDVLDDNYGR